MDSGSWCWFSRETARENHGGWGLHCARRDGTGESWSSSSEGKGNVYGERVATERFHPS